MISPAHLSPTFWSIGQAPGTKSPDYRYQITVTPVYVTDIKKVATVVPFKADGQVRNGRTKERSSGVQTAYVYRSHIIAI